MPPNKVLQRMNFAHPLVQVLAPNPHEADLSLLKRSNQLWKIYLFIPVAVLGGSVILFQGALYEPIGKELTMLLVGLGGLLGIGAFICACLFIRCPNCKLKLFCFAMSRRKFVSWLVWLLKQEECPRCDCPEADQAPEVNA